VSIFADSSALVKLYVTEVGHEAVRSAAGPLVIAALARVEVPAAFWGKSRTGALSGSDAALLVSAFEFDYHGDDQAGSIFAVVSLGESMFVAAARQASRHGLRAYEAVQLACAIAARGADPLVDTFAVFDMKLRDAAIAEGFSLLDTD
jgi:uncharacterized protein